MKLPRKIVDALCNKPNYKSLTDKDWQDSTWEFDDDPYYKEKDCWKLHNSNKAWIEIPTFMMSYHPKSDKTNLQLTKICNWLEENAAKYVKSEQINTNKLIFDLRKFLN